MLASNALLAQQPKRNMALVFEEISRRALREAAERERRIGPINAEMASASGNWHVISTHPQSERIAAAHLAARRFGIYVPMVDRVSYPKGKKLRIQSLMFPGYVFVFAWDVARNFRRIMACPGVARMLMTDTDGHPAIISDEFINRVQGEEARSIAEADGLWFRGKNKARRRRRKPGEGPEELVYKPKCYMGNIAELDEANRIGLLHKALGLPVAGQSESLRGHSQQIAPRPA